MTAPTTKVPWGGLSAYVWILSPNVAALATSAKKYGVESLIVKSSDGPRWLGSLERCGPIKEAGLRLGAWAYCYPAPLAPQITLLERALEMADYLVLDVEIEFQNSKIGAGAAKELVAALAPHKDRLGFTSFASTRLHQSFPYREFANGCAFSMPQCYWAQEGVSVERAFSVGVDSYRALGLPVVPIGDCGKGAQPGDIEEFSRLASSLPGCSWWEWYEADGAQMAALGKKP